MKINCYAVLDAKVSDFHLAIFDLKDEGAIRQFADAVNDKTTRWNRHPEDYSLWHVGTFDTTVGSMNGVIPVNLVNAVAVMSLRREPVPLELFDKNGESAVKEPVN